MADEYRDGGQDLDPEAFTEDDAGDPAAVFEALRATVEELAADLGREMTTIRKGVESAFDQLERQGAPVDYSADLGRIVQGLAAVNERIHAIERSPILRQGAEHYARALERSGEGLVRTAVQQLERQASDLERAGRNLAAHTRSAYDRKSQDLRMWTAGGFGIIAGISLLLILPRFLPFSADSHVASLIMGRDRVSAGHAMIQAADPARARDISTRGWVYETNRAAIDKYIKEMFQTKKEQRCILALPVVENVRGGRPPLCCSSPFGGAKSKAEQKSLFQISIYIETKSINPVFSPYQTIMPYDRVRPIMRAGTGLQTDKARLQLPEEFQHLGRGYPSEQGRRIFGAARGNVGSWRLMRTRSTMPFGAVMADAA